MYPSKANIYPISHTNIAPIYAFEQVHNFENVNASLYHYSFVSLVNSLHALCNLNNMTSIELININFIHNQDKKKYISMFLLSNTCLRIRPPTDIQYQSVLPVLFLGQWWLLWWQWPLTWLWFHILQVCLPRVYIYLYHIDLSEK